MNQGKVVRTSKYDGMRPHTFDAETLHAIRTGVIFAALLFLSPDGEGEQDGELIDGCSSEAVTWGSGGRSPQGWGRWPPRRRSSLT